MKRDTHDIFEELRLNLYHRFIFYIPSFLLPEIQQSNIPEILKHEVYDRIVLVNATGVLMTDSYESHLLQIIEKPRFLKQNIFSFIDLKTKLNSEQFTYLVEQYETHLKFYKWLSELLAKNLANNFPNIDSETKSTFELQLNSFDYHYNEFQSKIKTSDIKNNTSINPDIEIKEEKKIKTTAVTITQSNRLKKPSEITNDEVDAFLLQSVFGISSEYFK